MTAGRAVDLAAATLKARTPLSGRDLPFRGLARGHFHSEHAFLYKIPQPESFNVTPNRLAALILNHLNRLPALKDQQYGEGKDA